uniref:NAD(+) ADP-ribosyltransferase n=1 Tax=Arundo donax TaxID=35708 RepID=A0A0A9EYB0_ARUDO
MVPFQHETKLYMNLRQSFRTKLITFGLIARNSNVMQKKYTWLEMDYGEAEKETNMTKKNGSITDQIKETKLETRVAQFISLICNTSMMKQQMVEIRYNADKLPLGKLSKSSILKVMMF